MKTERQIIFHRHYFIDFYLAQTAKIQEKIEYVLRVIKTVDRVPEKFLKHLKGTDGLYEIRVEFESNIYRIFCFFDQDTLVVLFNSFKKKTQKTPKQELALPKKLKNEYFNLKGRHHEKERNKKS